MPRFAIFALAFGFVLPVFGPAPARAQGSGGAVSLMIDPSVRSSGMGAAGIAAFWGGDPNYWSNPALLGHERGLRYEWGRTQLVPDLADNVYFTTQRLTFAYWGVGISVAPKIYLDYGESFETAPGSAEPIGTFHSYEDVDSWGVGINIVEFAEHLARLGWDRRPFISRYADLSLGEARKDVLVDLAPATAGSPGSGDASTRDTGWLLRLTPYNSLDGPSALPVLDDALRPILGGLRLDAAYGESRQNTDPRTISIAGDEPIAIRAGRGLAVRAATGFPGAWGNRLDDAGAGWIARVLTPLLSFGKSWDRTQWHVGAYAEPENRNSGWELTIANLYTIRRGRVDDPGGVIHGNTSGWGLGLNFGDLGGFRYDRATIPQYIELDNVHRKSFTAWVDPIAAWRALNGGDAGPARY